MHKDEFDPLKTPMVTPEGEPVAVSRVVFVCQVTNLGRGAETTKDPNYCEAQLLHTPQFGCYGLLLRGNRHDPALLPDGKELRGDDKGWTLTPEEARAWARKHMAPGVVDALFGGPDS